MQNTPRCGLRSIWVLSSPLRGENPGEGDAIGDCRLGIANWGLGNLCPLPAAVANPHAPFHNSSTPPLSLALSLQEREDLTPELPTFVTHILLERFYRSHSV